MIMLMSRRSLQVLTLVCLPLFARCAQQPTAANPQAPPDKGASSLWSGKQGTYNIYLRFYPDGTVIGVTTTGTPSQIESWFKAPYQNSGRFSLNGSSIKFSLIDVTGTVDYDGVVRGSVLQLETYSHINGVHGNEHYQLENGVALPGPPTIPGAVDKNPKGGELKKSTDETSSSKVNPANKKPDAPPAKTNTSAARVLSGCICGFDELKTTVAIVPWNIDSKAWDFDNPKVFVYTDHTNIEGESKATIADFKGGKVVKSYHLTGFSMNGPTGSPFEIKRLADCVGRRTTLHWSEDKGAKVADRIELPYLFGGESMPAMIGGQSSQVFGSDNCPCGVK